MSHVAHDIHSEFPADGAILHQLKLEDRHFQTLSERYHDVNREVHRIEAGLDAASDARLETLKKQRLAMLDEISQLIEQARVD